jgi:hypothetical protein
MNLLAFLAGFAPYRMLGAFLAVLLALGAVYFKGRADGKDSIRAEWQMEKDALAAAQALTLSDAINRANELQRQKTQAEANYAQALADRDRRISALAASSLRDAAALRAAGTAADSLAACRADAAILRDVLSGVDAAAERLAAAADARADEVRVLLEAWPR